MTTFNFFDQIYCIHVPNQERHRQIVKQFARIGVVDRVQFIYAKPPPKNLTMSNMRRNARGEFGVNLSHIKAVIQAIKDGAERPLFVEDDIVFCDRAPAQLGKVLTDLPSDWDVLYMGGHPTGPIVNQQAIKISDALCKVGTFSFAEAYSLNRSALHEFVDVWCDEISQPNAMYDIMLGRFAKNHNAYCAYPLLCEQRVGKSSVTGKEDDKRSIVARAWSNHYGDENITEEHLRLALIWRGQHPREWKALMQRKKG